MDDANLKANTTETLKLMRAWLKDQMEGMQQAGRWEDADRYHETHICPLNDELLERGVW